MSGWMNQDCWEKYQQSQICRWHHPYGRKQRAIEKPLNESEKGEWKSCLKLNIQKTKIMASGPINSWQIDGERVETVTGFLGSKITPDDDHSHEINFFSLEEKLWPTWQRIKKQKHYFANKDLSSQIYGFSSSLVWMWELDYKESWGPKNWCFWTVVLEKTLESPFNCKSILKEIGPEYSLEGPMLKLKLQYFGHLMGRNDSLEKTLMLGKIKHREKRGNRGWDSWMASSTQ